MTAIMLSIISVAMPRTGAASQATLAWSAPTTYTDGTPLTSLGGYKVFTSTTSGSFSQGIDVGNITNYTLSNLNNGTTYYFAVTAYDTIGNISGFSTQKSFTTSVPPQPSSLYTLSAAAGSGGSITPSGSVVVSQGTSQTFSIIPNTGYSIASVTVDGGSVGAVASYTFSNVIANHTISASFKTNTTTTTAGKVVFAKNCGSGSGFTDSTGVYYEADGKYSGGSTNSTTSAIGNTIDDVLYQTWRYGNFSYNVPLVNGNYSVTLKFSDWDTYVGQRVFNVAMQGTTVLSNFDIFAKAGILKAYDVTIPVTVSNGTLTIKFTSVVDNAKINAIVVKTR
jgi:hypothetical protein